MTVNKLQRFEQIASFAHVLELTDFQDDDSDKPAARWHDDIFENGKPITLELACGKGTYTVELAKHFPQRNFVGIDIKGGRIWKGARKARAEALENVRFLRIYIDHLDEYFAAGEVSDIWITFPDPYPKPSDRNKRLTSPKFLDIYRHVLDLQGSISFKTDSPSLLSYTLRSIDHTGCELIEQIDDIYKEGPEDELLTIKTDFEKKHLKKGKTISYLKFQLPDEIETEETLY